ncbi:asparagine synthase-related protein [Amycolatopsis cihanbeyliensis]|uniref:asparagine synthase (glutamine-hydrolyzing) n=1 Tax=Amycolatopsis cihanbeyliensis TaxID=1128664 RepID=A0A542DE41_AMYCI|nr:asparagine synthase-related protein [Amycolatopsis cihanbeyliensis]TQJ01341.1 asparagine synthase (glutamine-hydrolysing) [Amycolatopsis cihanbeyliensis]
MLGSNHFFVVLPDTEVGPEVARLPALAADLRTIRYPSGRPWMVGRWRDEEMLAVHTGDRGLAIVGTFGADRAALLAQARALHDLDALTTLHRRWAGSYHLIGSVHGYTRVQGTAYGVRRVYHTEIGGTVIAADRAAVLARLTGADVNRSALATRLMLPTPYPLNLLPSWHGVTPVPPGHYLLMGDRAGAPLHRRWHRPPEPGLPGSHGAGRVRAELATAVALRAEPGGVVGTDFSGGHDSTSVAFLASRHLPPKDLVAVTAVDDARTSADARWARRAAAHLPGVRHEVLDGARLPKFYEDVFDGEDRFDAPSATVTVRNRITATARCAREFGARTLLTGFGGDLLFLGLPAHYHSLLLRRPLLSWQRLRGYRALFSWKWKDTLRALVDRRDFATALASVDPRNTEAMTYRTVRLDWLYPPRLPAWITEEAIGLIERELTAADGTAPLGPTRGRHIELAALDIAAEDFAVLDDLTRRAGIPAAAPYLDDHVVDAALSVRVEDRTSPFAYKGLLTEAMRGILPEEMTERETKSGSANAPSLRRQRARLATIWDDSALGALELIDPERVRALCATPDAKDMADNGLDTTLACEAWARTALPERVLPG